MRAYYDLLKHLKATFEAFPSIGTITTEGYIDMDNWRRSIYPIVDIFVTTSPQSLTTTALSTFNVEITCLDIRDVNKEDINDKFWGNTNAHDNWNTTHAILEFGKDKLIKDWNDNDITLLSATDLERIVLGKENGLDGWRTTWTIEVPKTYNTSCVFLELVSFSLDNYTAGNMTEATLTFTDAVDVGTTGELFFYNTSDTNIGSEDWGQFAAVDNVATVTLQAGVISGLVAGDYYILLDSGVVIGSKIGDNNKAVTDKTAFTFTIT